MTEQTYTIPADWGNPKPLDLYKLPPLLVITSWPIDFILSKGTTRKQRKYYAASIILGQPFNLARKDQAND